MRQEALREEKTEGESFKVAIGYDPEDDPSPLFDYAFCVAQLLCGEVVVVHALENVLSTETAEEEEKQIVVTVKKLLSELTNKLPPVPVSISVIYGKSLESFAQFVEKEGIKLFAFYYYKKLLGKTLSEEFLQELPTALLVVKDNLKFRPIKRILVPLDFSSDSLKQKEIVERLLSCGADAEVEFLHVMEEEDSAEEEEVRMLFSELFADMGKFTLLHGEAAEVISDYAKRGGFDLVVVGRVGKGLNIGYGTVTKKLLEELKCPLVVV